MRSALENVALLLILTLCLLADSIMDSFGPGTFAAVSAATLAAAELLRMTAAALNYRFRAKRKAPCITADQSTMQETTTRTHKGARCNHCTTAPSRKSRRIYRNESIEGGPQHMRNYAEFYSDQIQAVEEDAAEQLASMCRYIDKTGSNDEEGADRYQMNFVELTALRKFFESAGANAICLAFDYGRAKGYRAAQNAARREAGA